LFLHYYNEKQLKPFKRDILKIYLDVLQDFDTANIRLIIGHRNSPVITRYQKCSIYVRTQMNVA
jgi:predicted secreted protein